MNNLIKLSNENFKSIKKLNHGNLVGNCSPNAAISGCDNKEEIEEKDIDNNSLITIETSPIPTISPLSSTSSFVNSITKCTNLNVKRSDENKLVKSEDSAELLGSVTTQNCRTSARVIQKLKEISVRPITPPLNDRDQKLKDEKHLQKTPSQQRTNRILWANLERNFFFDALNEFGKEFDAISNYINQKLKRKNTSDQSFKTKEQIRTMYYQTFHKLSKYIKFSEDVKKPVQELYALINYGEMRRKLQFVSEKNCMKIKDLVYKGYVTVRSKGKNIRIKTPPCKALRKLNQLEDWLEDIKLPPKVDLFLRPASIQTWTRVQQIAQNPCVRTCVPLQKKLSSILRTFQIKWRSRETKMNFEGIRLSALNETKLTDLNEVHANEPQLCLRPPPDAEIHRPLVSITEFLRSSNICLNSYEDRIGVKIRGESLCHEQRFKRQRTDSGSADKKSPEFKKIKSDGTTLTTDTSQIKDDIMKSPLSPTYSSELTEPSQILENDDFFREILSSCDQDNNSDVELSNNIESAIRGFEGPKASTQQSQTKYSKMKCITKRSLYSGSSSTSKANLRPLINDDILRRIRKGWTISDCGDISVGDLYLVFGSDSKICFEYLWIDNEVNVKKDCTITQDLNTTICTTGILSYNSFTSLSVDQKKQQIETINRINNVNTLGNKLKQLLLIASLSERMKKKSTCYCGHVCDPQSKTKVEGSTLVVNDVQNNNTTDVFRQPLVPFRRPALALDSSVKQNPINNNNNNRPASRFRNGMLSRPLVQRVLPVQPGVNQCFDVLEVKSLQNNLSMKSKLLSKSQNEDLTIATKQQDKKLLTDTKSIDKTLIKETQITSESQNTVETSNSERVNSSNRSDLDTLMELSLPSPLPMPTKYPDDENLNDTFISIPPMSPINILKETPSESRWIEENLNDYSLSSLLGHLDEINNGRDITNLDIASNLASNLSVISESSVDYMSKFAEIAASMQSEEKDLN